MRAHDRVRGSRLGGSAGFTLVELLVVVGVISILAVIAIPQLIGSREKAWHAACEDNYKALAGELQNELDAEMANGNPAGASVVVGRVVPRHTGDKNPRNRVVEAYLSSCSFAPADDDSCVVGFCPTDPALIVATQYEEGAPRTYRIAVQ